MPRTSRSRPRGSGLSNFSLDDDNDPTLSNTKTFGNVVPGSYSVTEGAVTSWELTGLVCNGDATSGSSGTKSGSTANIDLKAGGSVTCTFTNTKAGRIIVDKVTDPSGDPASFTFDPSYGNSFTLTDLATPNDSGDLKPGTYSVSESALAGWDPTGASCDDGSPVSAISLQPGEIVTCTFHNTKRATIIDKKVMVGGTSTFTFTGDPSGSISTNNGTISEQVVPGQYTSTEAAKTGWDLTDVSCDDSDSTGNVGNATATFQAGPGETVTCTFTNTKRGHIVIDKQTVPAGDSQLFTFTPSYNGGQTFQLADATTPNDSGALVPGAYSVSEAAQAGWDQTSAVCDDGSPVSAISLQAGETVTCTFTNTKRGTIIVEKQTSPDGADGSFTFTGDAAGSIGDGGQIVVDNLKPGTYTSTEADPGDNFDLGAIVCDDGQSATPSSGDVATALATFHLDPGETVTCVFTNVERGTITIIKNAQPDSVQDFAYTTTGSGLSGFSLDDNGNNSDTLSNTKTFENLVAGSYSVTEGSVAGWELTSIDCTGQGGSTSQIDGGTANLTLTEGGSITCVYTNSKPSISIVKTAGGVADGGVFSTEPGNVTYLYVVTNTGPLALHDVIVTDDAGTPADTSDDFQATCPKTTLAAGESMTCTAIVDVTADTTNVAVVHGLTDKGSPVQASDDAKVVILVHGLVIAKSNNAPIETLELADGTTADLPTAEIGATVTFTLNYTFSGDPVTNGKITDVLPQGLTYVDGSATSDAQFTFDSYDSATRTLTWNAATVSASGTLTYQATVDAGANTLKQPLENTATIDSDQTAPDSDTSDVFVPAPPAGETFVPTPPPTDALAPTEPSDPGISLMLVLAILGILVTGVMFVTPFRRWSAAGIAARPSPAGSRPSSREGPGRPPP